jgi:uncharacterized protein YjbI with pentapeptide repeats
MRRAVLPLSRDRLVIARLLLVIREQRLRPSRLWLCCDRSLPNCQVVIESPSQTSMMPKLLLKPVRKVKPRIKREMRHIKDKFPLGRDYLEFLHPWLQWFLRVAFPILTKLVLLMVVILPLSNLAYSYIRDNPITPKDTSFGAIVQASVALVAGLVALITFYLTFDQKNKHYERNEIELRFKDVQDRFSNNESALMRGNAAIRIADIALTRRPGSPNLATTACFPYFEVAVSQLTSALVTERDHVVLQQIQTALERLCKFDNYGRHRLHNILIVHLTKANRVLYREFLGSFASAVIRNVPGTRRVIRKLRDKFSHPARTPANTRNNQLVTALRKTTKFREIVRYIRRLGGPTNIDCEHETLVYAHSLSISKDLLCLALQRRKFIRSNSNDLPCRLDGVYLANGDLRFVNLENALLHDVFFHGSRFDYSDLGHADVRFTNFDHTTFEGSQLKNASFGKCSARHASLVNCDLNGLKIRGGDFREAYFTNSSVEGAQFSFDRDAPSPWVFSLVVGKFRLNNREVTKEDFPNPPQRPLSTMRPSSPA